VTLGVIALLGGAVLGTIGFVWNEVRSLNKEFSDFRLEISKANVKFDADIGSLKAQLDEPLSK
jgi:hypothetical protein